VWFGGRERATSLLTRRARRDVGLERWAGGARRPRGRLDYGAHGGRCAATDGALLLRALADDAWSPRE
jgi:hypothetical protein